MQQQPPSVFDFLFLNGPSITFSETLTNLAVALILGVFIAILYRLTYKGYSYSATFVNTLVIITLVTTVVIMVIGNNLARAFGLVGAMSIIRFRTVLKDSRDIAFVFFALAVGMAAGAGNHLIGIVGGVVIGLIIVVLWGVNFGEIHSQELLLRFWATPQPSGDPPYSPIFEKYLRSQTLLNMRSARLGHFIELAFHVRFRDPKDHQTFIQELGAIEGIERISLILGEDREEL